ncbi:NAD(P)-binding protein [Daldinia vernicosa]|uniref:NAD(P)-binding protein n=1 Tax=Daldinia vernicosa TaxID=114800 RepID=UPI0020078C82|nr:NAD(P)-binding protein [Daldinia vernicosa]KAI0849009.1 NAD(P)-binding protein [Daldinia vernicosa]
MELCLDTVCVGLSLYGTAKESLYKHPHYTRFNITRIRVAPIGPSSSAKTCWAAQGRLPYLLSPRGKSHYEIVALLNSSIVSAEAARNHFSLPSDVRTYGDPNDLALDPDVNFIICCTRVGTHSLTTGPSLRAGKAVFIEWPLVENYEEAVALTANKRLDNSIIRLQGRVSPIVLKPKDILKSGRIGRILSRDIHAYGNLLPRDSLPEGLSYLHIERLEAIPSPLLTGTLSTTCTNFSGSLFCSKVGCRYRPVLAVLGKDGTRIKDIESDVPDFLAVYGKLAKGKADIAEDATLSVTEPIKIKIHDHASDEVIDVEWDWGGWQNELPYRSRIVAELYERYAHW